MTTLLPENLSQLSPTVGRNHMARGVFVSMFGKSVIDMANMTNKTVFIW